MRRAKGLIRLPAARIPRIQVERLEDRRLFSADLAAAYGATPPAALSPQGRQRITVRVANVGDAIAAGATTRLFATTDGSIDGTGDVLLASTTRSKSLKPGKSANLKLKFRVPADIPSGNYHLVAQVTDAAGAGDANPANDIVNSPSPVAIQQPFVDLGIAISDQPDAAVSTVGWDGQGTTVKVTAAIFNNGNVIADEPTSVSLYLSADTTLDAAVDVPLETTSPRNPKIKPGQAKPVTLCFRLPAGTTAGNYRLIAVVDPANTVAERDETNNTVVSPKALTVVNVPIGPPPIGHHGHHYHYYPAYFFGGSYYAEDYYYDDGYYYDDPAYYYDDGGGYLSAPPDDYYPLPVPIDPPFIPPDDWSSSGGSGWDDFSPSGPDFIDSSDYGSSYDWSSSGIDW